MGVGEEMRHIFRVQSLMSDFKMGTPMLDSKKGPDLLKSNKSNLEIEKDE